MSMAMMVTPLILLDYLWAIVRTLRSPASGREKAAWVAFVLLVPFVGVIAWMFFGPS